MSAPDQTFGLCLMVPDRIIPVIFVPGVMGSNLKGIKNAKGVSWTLDSKSSMKGWFVRGANKRKQYLHPDSMEVNDGGKITQGNSTMKTCAVAVGVKWAQ